MLDKPKIVRSLLQENSYSGQTTAKTLLFNAIGDKDAGVPSDWCVHHLNGRHSEHCQDNIGLMKIKDHSALHNYLRAIRRTLSKSNDPDTLSELKRKYVSVLCDILQRIYVITGLKIEPLRDCTDVVNGLFDDIVKDIQKRPHVESLAELKEDLLNKTLNPKLFDNSALREDVRQALIDIADTFIKDLQENNIPLNIADIWLVGSNAAYNYTDNSDIDIHVIANMDDIDCNGLLTIVYNYAKSDFNNKHDITVKGVPVEMYVEDSRTTAITNGVYSLLKDEWIKFPEETGVSTFDPNTSDLYREKLDAVDTALESNDVEGVQAVIDDLYLLRKESLAADGEFGEGNLVFKAFRNNGMLDELKDHKRDLQDKELTLEAMNKNKKQLVITPGDPKAGIAFFNSAMGMGEQLDEDADNSSRGKVYKIDKGHTITIKGDTVFVEYNDLYYERWYKIADATWWEPAEWDYDEIEIEYTYQMRMQDFIAAIWESLPLDAWDEADHYDREVGVEDAWIEKNLDPIISKYGSRIVDTIREDAQADAARKVAPEDTVKDPDFED